MNEDIAYIDNHGDVCLNKKEEVRICCGSHHKIIIDKLFGPACVKDLKIVWEGNDWNIRNKIEFLRKQNRLLKFKLDKLQGDKL